MRKTEKNIQLFLLYNNFQTKKPGSYIDFLILSFIEQSVRLLLLF